jgi:hypothetical protein
MNSKASFPSVEEYAALDVSAGSALDLDLQKTITNEQSRDEVLQLTDDFHHDPSCLTPMMAAWYRANIAPKRLKALAELESAFQVDAIGDTGVRSSFFEAEVDKLAQTRRQDQHQAIEGFYREFHDLMHARDNARREYEEARAYENGRDPVLPRPIVYWSVLAFLMAMEFLINFESILRVPHIASPFIATGATILLAIALGAAGHIHGEILKQWNYYFGPHDKTRSLQGARWGSMGAVMLLAALSFIGYARTVFIIPLIQEARILGSAPPSLLGSVLSMLLTNVIVYVISAAWSFIRHDQNPDYVVKAVRYNELKSQVLRKTTGLNAEFDRLDERYRQDIARAEGFERQQRGTPNYPINMERVSWVKSKDESVRGALDRYRNSLVQKTRDTGGDIRFQVAVLNKEDAAKTQYLTAEEYLAIHIHLKMLSTSSERGL